MMEHDKHDSERDEQEHDPKDPEHDRHRGGGPRAEAHHGAPTMPTHEDGSDAAPRVSSTSNRGGIGSMSGATDWRRGGARADGATRQARGLAMAEASRAPRHVATVLDDGKRYGHRFTAYAWLVLSLKYAEAVPWTSGNRPRSTWRTDEWVAHAIGDRPKNVRQARTDAERLAAFLVNVWDPAERKWHRIRAGNPYGETLSPDERTILDTQRRRDRRGPKVGRKLPSYTGKDPSTRSGLKGDELPLSTLSGRERRASGSAESGYDDADA